MGLFFVETTLHVFDNHFSTINWLNLAPTWHVPKLFSGDLAAILSQIGSDI